MPALIPRQKAMLGFALKVALKSAEVGDADLTALRMGSAKRMRGTSARSPHS